MRRTAQHGSRSVRVVAALCALTWLTFPGFGLIDLSVTWNAAWPQVLEAGWGLFFTVLVAAPFGLVVVGPRRVSTSAAQLGVAAAALAVSALLADEPRLVLLSLAIAVETAVVVWLAYDLLERQGWQPRPSAPLALVALAAAGPWLVYASRMYDLNREGLSAVAGDVSIGIDHYAVQGGVALAITALALLAVVFPAGRRFSGSCAGLTAAYLGVVSYAWPDAAGGFGRWWSAGAVLWGLALVLCAWLRSSSAPAA